MDVVHACGIKPQSVTLIVAGRVVSTGVRCWRISAVSNRLPHGGGCGASTGRSKAGADAANPEKSLIELLPQLPLEQCIYQMRSVMPLISHDVKRSVPLSATSAINGVNVIPCLTGWDNSHLYISVIN